MGVVLHIEASPKGAYSVSGAIAEGFLAAYRDTNPQDEVRKLNVFEEDLPEFSAVQAAAKFAPIYGRARTEEETTAWDRVVGEIRKFDEADKIVLSCPMWNYSIPYPLKQYIDTLIQPLETFSYDLEKMAHVGLLRNRPLQLILTRSSTPAGAYNDFQLPYLQYIFSSMGINDMRVITAGQTTKATEEERTAYIQKYVTEAKRAARAF